MDIRAGVLAAVGLLLVGAFLVMRSGFRSWLSARKLSFYKIKRKRQRGAFVTFVGGILVLSFAIWLALFGEPVAYRYFPPSPTVTLTSTITVVPSITLTPTLTLTPTITDTPSVTDTPTITPTPFVPPAIEALFESVITPNPSAVFSPLQFTLNCSNFLNFEAAAIFQNPIRYMCAVFTYADMVPGSQWTALWFRDGELVHYETIPWDGETGGYGFTDWEAPPEEWLPGNYEVQIFVGLEWKVVGQFLVQGNPPTPTPTLTLTPPLPTPPPASGTP